MSYNDSDPTDPTRNTLFQIKKISAGGDCGKYAKGFLGGAQHGKPC
jgi:hypothetical protein